MIVFVNQQKQKLTHAMHLQELVEMINPKKPFAISYNGAFIPKEKYAKTLLVDQDDIQIIVPVTGG
jgi:thiamine biosynthesis protein ThiS